MPAALALPGLGLAQGAAAPAASAAASASSSDMQRAQRAAESPLRAIIEAARVRRRTDLPASSIATAPAAPGQIALAPRAAALAAGTAPESVVSTIRTLPGEPSPPASKADRAPALLSAVARLPLSAPQAELPQVQPMPASPAPAAALPAASASASGPPRLVHMVEPDLPARVLDTLTRREVAVEFTIGTDGSVSDVKVSLPAPRPLVGAIVAAVQLWRFEPQRAPLAHRVVLVFEAAR